MRFSPFVERIPEQGVAAIDNPHGSELTDRPVLREALAGHYGRLLGRELNATNVITLTGAQDALLITSKCLLAAGDEVIVVDPMHPTGDAHWPGKLPGYAG